MPFPSQLEVGFMRKTVVISTTMRFLLAHDQLSLVVDSICYFVLGEIGISMAHGFEHHLMDDLALPQFLLLPLYLLPAAVFVTHVREGLEELCFYSRGWVGDDIGRLSLNLA